MSNLFDLKMEPHTGKMPELILTNISDEGINKIEIAIRQIAYGETHQMDIATEKISFLKPTEKTLIFTNSVVLVEMIGTKIDLNESHKWQKNDRGYHLLITYNEPRLHQEIYMWAV